MLRNWWSSSRAPHLQFALGLVELQVFSLGDKHDSRLVVPQIVMRTKEITRAVIELKGNGDGIKINSDSKPEENTKHESPRRTTISEKVFFEELEANAGPDIAEFAGRIIDDFTTDFTELQWLSSSFSIRFVDEINPDADLSILNIKKNGKFNLGRSVSTFKLLQLQPNLATDYARRMAELTGIKTSPQKPHLFEKDVDLSILKSVYPKAKKIIGDYINVLLEAVRRSPHTENWMFRER